MIVPMKKAALVIQSKDADDAARQLRSIGILHVEHQSPPSGKDIIVLKDDISLVEKALGILKEMNISGASEEKGGRDFQWEAAAKHIVDVKDRIEQLEEYSINMKARITQWEPWGDFDPAEISRLAEKNIYVRLYQVPCKEVRNFPSSVVVKVASTINGVSNCIVVSRESIETAFKEIALPKTGLSDMRRKAGDDIKAIETLKQDLRDNTRYYGGLLRIKKSLEKDLEFSEVLRGMGSIEEISYIMGYVPHESADKVMELAGKNRWAVMVKDPSDEDNVPTLVRNPKWISVISNVFKLIEVVPGYSELDISLWFLIFLSIFYGMLIGDAGYGLVLLLLTVLAQKKWGARIKHKSIFGLFYLLNSCSVIWGILTGTFFGQEWLGQAVKPLIPALKSDRNVQTLCFFIGALHLSIAHIWRAILKAPSLKAIADIGWTLILWGGFLLAKTLILGYTFPAFAKWFFIVGCAFVILFTNPKRNVLKGIGSGLGALLLSLVNSFTDVVSYIRLFAVGLAGVAIADAFNTMAMAVGYNNFLSSLITISILLLGHTLNITLGPLAVIVHGVRLNVLEFCGHLDIKWSGFSYKPFREERV